MRFGLLLPLAPFFLAACGGSEPVAEVAPTPPVYYDGNASAGIDAQAGIDEKRQRDLDAEEARQAGKAPGLAFEGITLGPLSPRIEDVLEVEAKLTAGSSAFAEVDYTWLINGRSLPGVTRDSLDARAGRFRKGDTVQVRAEAMDERGQIATVSSGELVIENTPPVILNDIRRRPGIDGLVMKGEDADGDEITWSIQSGPPGISINRQGRVEVEARDLDEAFDGEVVIVGTDPDGARAELHVPVAINAAVEEVIGEKTTTKGVYRDQMTDEDYERINLESGERVMKMNEEEFNEHWAEQERREEERNREQKKK